MRTDTPVFSRRHATVSDSLRKFQNQLDFSFTKGSGLFTSQLQDKPGAEVICLLA
jgi:hypothetical protein